MNIDDNEDEDDDCKLYIFIYKLIANQLLFLLLWLCGYLCYLLLLIIIVDY